MMKLIKGGLEPICTMELKIAKLVWPFKSTVPIRQTLLKPPTLLIK